MNVIRVASNSMSSIRVQTSTAIVNKRAVIVTLVLDLVLVLSTVVRYSTKLEKTDFSNVSLVSSCLVVLSSAF